MKLSRDSSHSTLDTGCPYLRQYGEGGMAMTESRTEGGGAMELIEVAVCPACRWVTCNVWQMCCSPCGAVMGEVRMTSAEVQAAREATVPA